MFLKKKGGERVPGVDPVKDLRIKFSVSVLQVGFVLLSVADDGFEKPSNFCRFRRLPNSVISGTINDKIPPPSYTSFLLFGAHAQAPAVQQQRAKETMMWQV